jgi:hypothetical protein
MSEIIIEDPVMKAIMADPQLANARRKLSFHEIRLIIQHARSEPKCPFCAGRSSYSGDPKNVFCEKHLEEYRETGAA